MSDFDRLDARQQTVLAKLARRMADPDNRFACVVMSKRPDGSYASVLSGFADPDELIVAAGYLLAVAARHLDATCPCCAETIAACETATAAPPLRFQPHGRPH